MKKKTADVCPTCGGKIPKVTKHAAADRSSRSSRKPTAAVIQADSKRAEQSDDQTATDFADVLRDQRDRGGEL